MGAEDVGIDTERLAMCQQQARIPMTADEQNEAILASHKRKPNKSSWQTDPIVEPSKSNEHETI